jgi:hypothetical protein
MLRQQTRQALDREVVQVLKVNPIPDPSWADSQPLATIWHSDQKAAVGDQGPCDSGAKLAWIAKVFKQLECAHDVERSRGDGLPSRDAERGKMCQRRLIHFDASDIGASRTSRPQEGAKGAPELEQPRTAHSSRVSQDREVRVSFPPEQVHS